jgi:hypothetical protein
MARGYEGFYKVALRTTAFPGIPKHLVRAEWNDGMLKVILATVKEELGRDTSRPEGDEGTVTELAGLLREHFSKPVPRYYGGPATDPPNRLVYLLDHEYTPRALSWTRLKGADASRVSLLRIAAERTGCEAVLALADIKTTHGAFPADEGYGYRRRGWHDDYDDDNDEYSSDASDSEREYDIQELIDSDITLTHWTGPDGTRLEETSLSVDGDEVCASTPTQGLGAVRQGAAGGERRDRRAGCGDPAAPVPR